MIEIQKDCLRFFFDCQAAVEAGRPLPPIPAGRKYDTGDEDQYYTEDEDEDYIEDGAEHSPSLEMGDPSVESHRPTKNLYGDIMAIVSEADDGLPFAEICYHMDSCSVPEVYDAVQLLATLGKVHMDAS